MLLAFARRLYSSTAPSQYTLSARLLCQPVTLPRVCRLRYLSQHEIHFFYFLMTLFGMACCFSQRKLCHPSGARRHLWVGACLAPARRWPWLPQRLAPLRRGTVPRMGFAAISEEPRSLWGLAVRTAYWPQQRERRPPVLGDGAVFCGSLLALDRFRQGTVVRPLLASSRIPVRLSSTCPSEPPRIRC